MVRTTKADQRKTKTLINATRSLTSRKWNNVGRRTASQVHPEARNGGFVPITTGDITIGILEDFAFSVFAVSTVFKHKINSKSKLNCLNIQCFNDLPYKTNPIILIIAVAGWTVKPYLFYGESTFNNSSTDSPKIVHQVF